MMKGTVGSAALYILAGGTLRKISAHSNLYFHDPFQHQMARELYFGQLAEMTGSSVNDLVAATSPLWVQYIPQCVPEEIYGEDGEKDSEAGKEDDVGVRPHGTPAVLGQGPPACAPLSSP